MVKFLKPGKAVILLQGRYAGRKAVIVKSSIIYQLCTEKLSQENEINERELWVMNDTNEEEDKRWIRIQKQDFMYEKRNEEIILPKHQKPINRISRFLKPFAKNLNQIVGLPKSPLLSDLFTHKTLKKWPFKVHFTGWEKPQEGWSKWYDKLVIEHATTWIQAGILDGIHASLHEISCNRDLVLGVCEFWCPKTNTFMFPWGEATITLEDVMILGGFPVIGSSIEQVLEGYSCSIVEGLARAKLEICNGSHSAWMKHFMEEEEEDEEGEFEHVAFLSLWLSRFVFPDFKEKGIIGTHVFKIATHLSKGNPIAIAPVVLANLYHEMTILTLKGIDSAPDLESEVHVSGLFQIVQLWVCERFNGFGVKLAKPLELGDPRLSRWEIVDFEVTPSLVRSRLESGTGFIWRPYACDLENWVHLPFYAEKEQMFTDCSVLDDYLLSFARFLHSTELVGMDCKEKYQPNRVAMQFGYDQEIPSEFRVSTSSWDKGGLYIPSKSFEPGVSKSYYNWWKDSMLRREEFVMDAFVHDENWDSNLDHVPLYLRLRSIVSKAIKSGRGTLLDIDLVPLALRIEWISKPNTGNTPRVTTYVDSQITGEIDSLLI